MFEAQPLHFVRVRLCTDTLPQTPRSAGAYGTGYALKVVNRTHAGDVLQLELMITSTKPHSEDVNTTSQYRRVRRELVPPVQKQPRANRKRVDSITLVNIAQYFHLPIKEASKALNIGVSALKAKCRQYGIPRWPHRKIKSLDALIHDLEYVLTTEDGHQDEWLQNKNADARKALKEKKRLLESEKEAIRQKPALDLRAETKLFRQFVFKRKNKAQSEVLKVQRGINISL